MTNYDPVVIQEFAEKMYKRANSIIVSATLLGILLGVGLGAYFGRFIFGYSQLLPVVGLIFGGIIGYVIGANRSFVLKLQAQTALCQMKIEQNTRKFETQTGGKRVDSGQKEAMD